jgi:hypothetical protein
MVDRYPPPAQREALLKFAEALGSVSTSLRRDDCNDPQLKGRYGHISAVPGGFQVYVIADSKQAWTWAKKSLAFAQVTQDGDDEGMLFLDRLPTPTEAETIRSYVGISKKPDRSPEEVERVRQMTSVWRKTSQGE